jgi:phosphoribosyl 1,2-cyclic phosphodiesterase
MKIKVWGCRGSLPSPGPENNKYGGNTSCISVTVKDTLIILDGGSGILRLGKAITPEVKELHVLLTHLHIDHTMGLGFFQPLYNPNIQVHIWGPSTIVEPLLHRLRSYFSPPLFPVRLSELPKHPIIHEIGNTEFEIGDLKIKSSYICHPGPTLGFRITDGNSVFAYMPDHEPALGSADFPSDLEWTSGVEIAENADLLFHDGQYTDGEYKSKIGWGHSSVKQAIAFGEECKVKKMAIFHHDPLNSDERLEEIYQEGIRQTNPAYPVIICKEGEEFELG